MSDRQLQLEIARNGIAGPTDLVMRYPPNWTAVIFFACMSLLHLVNGLGAFWKGRIEGEMSAVLGVAFAIATAVAWGELPPRASALDRNCKAHELDNLYVVDGSFFPSSGAVNPALTIMANALRVGDHLIGRMS